jgi:hypothetical protein
MVRAYILNYFGTLNGDVASQLESNPQLSHCEKLH